MSAKGKKRTRFLSLFICIGVYQVPFMTLCVGKGGACAKLTWDDTSRFNTTGSPETKSLTWKGYFKVINCLTCLTWVCEGLRDPGWSHNPGWNAAWIFLICQVVERRSPHHVQRADAATATELVTPPTDFLFSFLFFQGLACCLSEWKYFTWPQLMWWCSFHNPTLAVTPVVFVPICCLKIGCLKFHVNDLVTKISLKTKLWQCYKFTVFH